MANEIYVLPQTAKTFKPSGGTAVFTPTSLGNGNGRISAQLDLGAAARPALYWWSSRFKVAALPTVKQRLELFLALSDGAYVPGNLGTADATFTSSDSRYNLTPLGAVVIDAASTVNVFFATGGPILIAHRYVSFAWWNATGVTLSGTAGDVEAVLSPVPFQIQA